MNTDPKSIAQQLRLAADILETGHPFMVMPKPAGLWCVPTQAEMNVLKWPVDKYEIRPILATPPDGRPLHNPDNLTTEQVGVGYRLTTEDEQPHEDAEYYLTSMWVKRDSVVPYRHNMTYRLPLSVPWPEPADPSPFQLPPPPPGMQWHREDGWKADDLPPGTRPLVKREIIEQTDQVWSWDEGPWVATSCTGRDTVGAFRMRTTRPLVFTHEDKQWTWHRPGDPMPTKGGSAVVQLLLGDGSIGKTDRADLCIWNTNPGPSSQIIGWRYAEPATKKVELGPEDVKPFTVIRRKGEAQAWHWRTVSHVDAVKVTCGNRGYGWEELASDYECNESLPLTGRWNPTAWEPCHKTIPQNG